MHTHLFGHADTGAAGTVPAAHGGPGRSRAQTATEGWNDETSLAERRRLMADEHDGIDEALEGMLRVRRTAAAQRTPRRPCRAAVRGRGRPV